MFLSSNLKTYLKSSPLENQDFFEIPQLNGDNFDMNIIEEV
jgi:hypothetical protein